MSGIEAIISDFGGVLTSPLLDSFAAFQDSSGISLEELGTAMRRWATAMTSAGQLLVITTPNGLAAPLADAIDEAGLADVAGTVAGENTIFVAARDGMTGADLEEQFRHHLGRES